MPYIIKGQSARWVDPAEGYVLQTGESFGDEVPDSVPDFESLKAAEKARWMVIRDQYAGRLASIASRLYASAPAGSASADAVATSLLGLFTAPAVLTATDITAYKAALKARYTQAVMLATPSAAAEFGKYDK